jgi:hypothetical protein
MLGLAEMMASLVTLNLAPIPLQVSPLTTIYCFEQSWELTHGTTSKVKIINGISLKTLFINSEVG